MDTSALVSLFENALLSAPGAFEDAASPWRTDRMPESWLTYMIMQEASRQGLAVFPEVRIRHDVQVFLSGGQILSPEKFPDLAKAGAKIDLFVGERMPKGSAIPLRAALELKGPKSNWNAFRSDIDRLRQIRSVANGNDQVVVFAYVTCPLF